MNDARDPHRIRTFVAILLLAGAATVSLAGCSSTPNSDGAYVEIDSDGGIDSVWVFEGDEARFANASCDDLKSDLAEEVPGTLSDDRTEMKSNGAYDDTYQLVWFKGHAWYPDGSGFAWDDHGDYVRDDSDAGKAAVEKREAECGEGWPE